MPRKTLLDPPLTYSELLASERAFVERCANGDPPRHAGRIYREIELAVRQRRLAAQAAQGYHAGLGGAATVPGGGGRVQRRRSPALREEPPPPRPCVGPGRRLPRSTGGQPARMKERKTESGKQNVSRTHGMVSSHEEAHEHERKKPPDDPKHDRPTGSSVVLP